MKTRMTMILALALGGAALNGEPVELGLKEAIHQALEQNPAIQRQAMEQALRDAESQEARGALLPTLQAQAYETRHSLNYETFTGEPARGIPVVIGPFSVRSVGLEAHVPLLDLSLWRRWRASKSLVDASRAETDRMREEISALVAGQYLLALRAEAQVRAIQARIELAKSLEDLAIHQEQSGVGTGLDTLRAKVRTQTEEQALIRARTAQLEALSGLVRLLDFPTDSELHPKPLPAPDAAPVPEPTLAEDVRSALSARSETRALDAQGRAAEERVSGAHALHYPTVQAFASVEDMGLVKTQLERVYEVGVQVKLPLFMGGRIRAQESQARIALNQIDTARRELEAQVAFELRTARERLEAARSEVILAEESLSLAKAELEQARHRFEAGVSNNIELVSAQEELAWAEEGSLDANYRLNQAQVDLAHARGELETRYAH